MRNNTEAIVRHMIKQNNHKMNIAFPAIVVGVDNLSDGFIDVRPSVNFMNSNTGETMKYPTISNVRVIFPSSKNSTISFPLVQGDTVDLVFQSVDIQDFVNGNKTQHDPYSVSYANLNNVVAIVGFTSYQESPFNAKNYSQEFDNTSLNIVHNKNTDNEASISINTDGDIKMLSPTKVYVESPTVSYECQNFEVSASEKISLTAPLISENGR